MRASKIKSGDKVDGKSVLSVTRVIGGVSLRFSTDSAERPTRFDNDADVWVERLARAAIERVEDLLLKLE